MKFNVRFTTEIYIYSESSEQHCKKLYFLIYEVKLLMIEYNYILSIKMPVVRKVGVGKWEA